MALSSTNNRALSFLLCLLISPAFSHAIDESFLRCLSRLTPPSTNISQLLYLPNSPSYSSLLASTIQNLRFASPATRKPLLIIAPTRESHIQAAVVCCRSHGLPIRIRSGGHDYEGLSYRSESDKGFVLIDLAGLRSISVDADRATAWVQAGATLGEFYYRIQEKSGNLAFTAGTCPTVCAGGHISGGGYGTLYRKYGLASDNVLDARLVDANGNLMDREAMGEDLFWAIRGGGGASFGIIVSWKLRLVPVPSTVSAFTVRRTREQGAVELLNRWQHVAPKLHGDLFLKADVHSPMMSGEKEVVAAFISLFLGGCAELLERMAESFPELGVEKRDCREMSWIESVLYYADYPDGVPTEILLEREMQPKIFSKGKSDYVKEPISVKVWEGIWESFEEQGAGSVYMNPYGARMSEISASATPFPHRQGNLFIVHYLVMWNDSRDTACQKHLGWIRRMYRYMTPYVSKNPRAAYLNFRDLDLGRNEQGNTSYSTAKVWGRKYFEDNFRRLAIVKGNVDPEDFFRDEQSVPPLFLKKASMGSQRTGSKESILDS